MSGASGLSESTRRLEMVLARVVTFERVRQERMDELNRQMREGERPEGLPASELVALHHPESDLSSRC
jgi:hypothetical protein